MHKNAELMSLASFLRQQWLKKIIKVADRVRDLIFNTDDWDLRGEIIRNGDGFIMIIQ